MRRIARLFHSPGKKLVPFITAGFPHLEDTVALVLAAERAGAHMVEIGIPFSDPLADGPVIQQTSQVALANGVTVPWILEAVTQIREHSQVPIVLMGYINPLLNMGLDTFLKKACEAGVDGLIIPDLLPEEGTLFFKQARSMGLSTIYLVAPNTPDDRIQQLGREAEDLLYAVSILGVTGSALAGQEKLDRYLDRVRAVSKVPFVVGFGISTPEDVQRAAVKADGVVVGSALLACLDEAADPVKEAVEYLRTLAAALSETSKDTVKGASI
ncbi:MAG: tryptophan synthase subunit alpha [Fidelibacterota bacterium]|nr:MAG: tryptophan synthase subunit alpha [Candidatus Neomarinimicrobiota bacterium]